MPTTDVLWLLAAQQVEYPEQTAIQYWIAVVGIVVIGAALLIAWYRSSYAGLDEAAKRHKAAARYSRTVRDSLAHRVPRGADIDDHATFIRELIEAATSDDDAPGRMTVTAALGEVRRAISSALGNRFDTVPRLAVLVAEVGALVVVLGAMAVSTDAVVYYLGYEAGGGGNLLAEALDLTVTTLDTGFDLLTTFPGAEFLSILSLSYLLLAAEWLYTHWYVVGSTLLVAAALVAYWGRRYTDVDPQLYATRWSLPLSVAASLGGVWLVGITPTLLGHLADYPRIGAVLGFLAAFILGVYLAWNAVRNLLARVRGAVAIAATDHPGRTGAYILVRKVAAIAASLATPLIPVYLAVLVLDGRLWRIVDALFAASLEVQLAAGTTLFLTTAWLIYAARSTWPDVRTALAETTARRRVRFALLRRGIPYTGLAVGYIAGYTLTDSVLLGVVVAVLAAVTAGTLSALIRRAHTRTQLFGGDDPLPEEVLVEASVLVDDNGDEYPTVRLNGDRRLRFPDVETAVEETIAAVDTLAQGEAVETTMWEWAANDLLKRGIPDFDRSRQRAREACREDAVRLWEANHRSVSMDTFNDELEAYPLVVREELLEEWSNRGIVDRRPGSVSLRRNPWAVAD